jgi:hypothetical protein
VPFGLTARHVHDASNIFQKTWMTPQDGSYHARSDAKAGNRLEHAEIAPPGGLLAVPGWLAVLGQRDAPLGFRVFADGS